MSNYKQEITLNERDSLVDTLSTEKQIIKAYALARTEGCSKGFLDTIDKNYRQAVDEQFMVFSKMTEHDYYSVQSAKEDKISSLRKTFASTKKLMSESF
jgi:spore coat protein CotF